MRSWKFRLSFWILFLGLCSGFLHYFWKKTDPLHKNPSLTVFWTDHQLALLTHPNAKVASKAWFELNNLYFLSWTAYAKILTQLDNGTPIHFLVESVSVPVPGKPAVRGFTVNDRLIFYKTERIYCQTVGEALSAILYNERNWKTDWDGSWQSWWESNRKYYEK